MTNEKMVNGVTYVFDEMNGMIEAFKGDNKLGTIWVDGNDEWNQILNGADPIDDGWEDGMGNDVNAEGWGQN